MLSLQILKDLKGILQSHEVDTKQLEGLQFQKQFRKREEREYVFAIDVSNPEEMGASDLKVWKKQAKEVA